MQSVPTLTISTDDDFVAHWFNVWRSALLDGATREQRLWQLSEQRIVFRNQADEQSDRLERRVALGIDPQGQVWAVQINEADSPGDPNVLSAIARDQKGRPYLIRQGRLNPNAVSKRTILYDEFRHLTGMTPAEITNGNTKVKRDWYVVARLDRSSERIRDAIGRFVDQCVIARTGGAGAGSTGDMDDLADLYAPDETGGTYQTRDTAAVDPKTIRKQQGDVWFAIATKLRGQGISVEKPRHAAGYAVDAEVVSGDRSLVIEIKTGATPADVYGGLGQLMLYRKLLPRLVDHTPVLLLPELPAPALRKALKACGVELCTFDYAISGTDISVTFSPRFLKLCGANVSS